MKGEIVSATIRRITIFKRAVALCGLVTLTACSTATGSSSTADPSSAPSGGSVSARAGVPKETIGILNITAASEATVRPQNAAIAALQKAGWDYKIIDAQGDPQKSAAGLNSFVTQGVSAVISIANQPAVIQSGLQAAKAKNIPVINIAGAVPKDPNLAASYAPDEKALTSALNDYMFKHVPSGSGLATLTAPSIYALGLRDGYLTDDLKAQSLKVAANHEIDFTNPVADAQKSVTDILTANPNVGAFWTDTDFDVHPTAQVLKSKNLCGKVQVYGYYANKANMQAIRDGCATAVVEAAIDASGTMAVDALLGYFVDKTPIPSTPDDVQGYFKPTVIDKSNVPAEGAGNVPPPADFLAFFDKKWSDAYGI